MFVKLHASEQLIEVLTLNDLFNPNLAEVVGRRHNGSEVGDIEKFTKTELVFLSGESMPHCWVDSSYHSPDTSRPILDEVP